MSLIALAAAIFVLSVAGGLAPLALAGGFDEERMRTLTTVGGGFLLGSALLVVVPEGFHAAEVVDGRPSELTLGAALLAGFALMLVFEGFGVGHSVHEEHHDHATDHGHGHIHHPARAGALPLGLSVHALADGVAIGAASASGQGAAAALVAVAVLLHKVPAAFSLGTYSAHEWGRSMRAVRDVIAFALVTPVALVAADRLLDGESAWLALLLLFSAGTFLYVATVDTLPGVHDAVGGKRTAFNVILGAALFALILAGLDATGVVTELH